MCRTQFRLLGPLELVINDEPVAIAPGRQEVILTLLLLEANHVVSADRMIDALWGDAPPRTARNQVQIAISMLRQLVGDGIIVTRPPGYVIKVPAEDFDLARFEAHVARAGDAVARQRITEAVQHLRQALGQWRGDAVQGVQSEVVRAAATHLNERRLTVLQDSLDLELQLGRHREVIGELTQIMAAHPLNERLRAQLMLALYRSGRQADALECFRRGREILAAELGLDPSAELRALESAILTRDPRIDPEEVAPGAGPGNAAAALPVPRQLPRAIADFTGREDILTRITAIMSGSGDEQGRIDVPVVVLSGRGGMGKTTLAVRAAHLLSSAYPDGQLFVRFSPEMRQSVSGVIEHLLISVGLRPEVIPADLETRASVYRSWLAERRMLIVIDGADRAAQLVPLLPGTHGCAAILTSSQRPNGLDGAVQLDVGPLDDQSAHALLESMVGSGRVRAEQQATGDLIRLCEGLPLALRIVAAKLAARPHWAIDQMVRQLLNEERRLDALDLDGASVRATLALSYQTLPEPAKRLFRRLSWFGPEDFAAWVAAPLLDCDLDYAEEQLQELVLSHLVEARSAEDDSVRYHLHDLVRIYAMERLVSEEPASSRLESARRMLGCWLYLVNGAHHRTYGGHFGLLHGSAERWPLPAEITDALVTDPSDWFARERSSLVTAIYRAGQLNFDELCWELAVTSATLFESGTYSDDWRDSHLAALEVVRKAGNQRGEAALLHSLGNLELSANVALAQEHYERSLKIANELGDDKGRALALGGLASVDRLGGRYELALARYEEATIGFRAATDLVAEAHMLRAMAQIRADWRDFDSAEQLLETSLTLSRKLGSARLTAQSQYELAELHLRRDWARLAAEAFELVLHRTQAVGDVVGQAYALAGLGNARRKLGDFAGARSALTTAQSLANAGNDRLIRGRILLALGELDDALDQHHVALSRTGEAVRVLREYGAAGVWHGRALAFLGCLHQRAGRIKLAEHAWTSAAKLVDRADPELASQLADDLAKLPEEG